MNVLLINMPFSSLHRPSPGLGLLKSHLVRIGIDVRVANLNLRFAQQIGQYAYARFSDYPPQLFLACDWIFAAALADGPGGERDAYYSLFSPNVASTSLAHLTDGEQSNLIARAEHARANVEEFLDFCIQSMPWERYDLVGFTTTFCQTASSLALARRVKDTHPDTLIVFGGAHCEGEMGLALHEGFSFVDYVCTGEADLSFPALVRALETGTRPEQIRGIVCRSGDASWCTDPAPERVKDLDELPYPDHDEYFNDPLAPSNPELTMETARGCWWGDKHHCLFCGIDFPEKYRSKTPARALAELVALRDRYGPHPIVMSDEILDLRYFKEFLPALTELDPPASLFYEIKANLSREQVRLLSEAGVRRIQPGIESFSTGVLKLMNKGTSAAQNVQLLKWCAEFDVVPYWNLLFGFPGEAPEHYETMADLMTCLHHLQPPGSCHPIRLDRFSPYFLLADHHGIVNVRASRAYALVYPQLSPELLARFAYFFEFDYADGHDRSAYGQMLQQRVEEWEAEHRTAHLRATDDGVTLTLEDSRACAAQPTHSLDGWHREVYLACEAARPEAHVQDLAAESGATRAELDSFLAALLDSRLAVKLDGRLLALAVAASPPDPNRSSAAAGVAAAG